MVITVGSEYWASPVFKWWNVQLPNGADHSNSRHLNPYFLHLLYSRLHFLSYLKKQSKFNQKLKPDHYPVCKLPTIQLLNTNMSGIQINYHFGCLVFRSPLIRVLKELTFYMKAPKTKNSIACFHRYLLCL